MGKTSNRRRAALAFCYAVALVSGLSIVTACTTKTGTLHNPAVVAPSELAPAARDRILAAIGPAIEAHYVFPDVGVKMVTALREHIARGDYNRFSTNTGFAAQVTDDLRAVSHDRHVMLEYLAEAPPTERAANSAESLSALQKIHFGIGSVEWLDGHVARLVIDSFEDPRPAETAIADAMSSVSGADAILIDLRSNHGGNPWGVAHVASYFFDGPPVHWNDMSWHDENVTEQFFTKENVPGRRIGAAKPLFVLVGAQTFSAAEEFAYGMQAQKRAVIVGAKTKGGAHPVCPTPIDERYSMRVPCGRAINPVTHGNWEGTGVIPDVIVDEKNAVRRAHKLALAAIVRQAPR